MKTLKTTITTTLILLSLNAYSQEKEPTHKIVGNEIVKIDTEELTEKTNLTHKIGDVTFEVFKNKKGRLFVFKISKKTGKKYKYYFNI